MPEHNSSLIPIIVAEDSRKIEKTDYSRKLNSSRSVDGARLDEVPMGLFRSGSFIFHKPPKMLITNANMQAALGKGSTAYP